MGFERLKKNPKNEPATRNTIDQALARTWLDIGASFHYGIRAVKKDPKNEPATRNTVDQAWDP